MRLLFLWLVALPALFGQTADIGPAFAAARRGKLEPVAKLKVTPADIPAVARYLRDPNERVRREALVLLGGLGQPACSAVTDALTDRSADLRERAARILHQNCPPAVTAGMPKLAPALRESIRLGNPAAAAVLLLGRFRDEETRRYLARLVAAQPPVVKLESWTPAVPQSLAASVAAASIGDASAMERLERALGPLDQAEFLASVLVDIESPASLARLRRLLDDQRTVATGVPSGAEPRLRICDLALEGFVKRLRLKTSFALRPSDRYTAAEFTQVKDLAAKAL